LRGNGGEFGVQIRSKAIHDRSDCDRNAGYDQTVLDGGGRRTIRQETFKQGLHRCKLLTIAPDILAPARLITEFGGEIFSDR